MRMRHTWRYRRGLSSRLAAG